MEIVHERAAGMDISKRDAKVCIRVPGTRAGSFSKTVTTYGATTNEILRLRRDLEVAAVTVVVMEATGAREAILLPIGRDIERRTRQREASPEYPGA